MDDPQIKQEVPEDGNKEVKSTLWTAAELKQHDEMICGWVRWEVDKSTQVVWSTKCVRLTANQDGVCDDVLGGSAGSEAMAGVWLCLVPFHRQSAGM